MKTGIILTLTILFCASCSKLGRFKYRNVSEFRMDTAALHEGEAVDVVYFSSGPDYNQDREYLFHYIVISRQTGDTVNVFSAGYFGIKSNESMDFILYNKGTDTIGVKPGVKNLWTTDIKKVVVNTENSIPDENHFKSIIGSLGKVTSMPQDSASSRLIDTIHY